MRVSCVLAKFGHECRILTISPALNIARRLVKGIQIRIIAVHRVCSGFDFEFNPKILNRF